MTERVNLGGTTDANVCLLCMGIKKTWCCCNEEVINKSAEYGCKCKAMFHPSCWKDYDESFSVCPWCRVKQIKPRYTLDIRRYDIAINGVVDTDDTHHCSTMCCVSFVYGVILFSVTVSGMEKSNGDVVNCVAGGTILLVLFSWIAFCCMCMCSPRRLLDRNDPYGENLPFSPCLKRWMYAKIYMGIVCFVTLGMMVYAGVDKTFNRTMTTAIYLSGGYVIIGIITIAVAAFKLFVAKTATIQQVS